MDAASTQNRPSLESLNSLPTPAQRGRELESFVAHLFRDQHFTVMLNSGTARPRQTDLLAVKLAERFLIECKWRRKPANIDDIDSLRSRLSRTSPDVVGILVSMGGFTSEVFANVRYQRHQPILLVSGEELRDLEAGFRASLPDLLHRKKEGLLRDGAVLLDDSPVPPARVRPLPLPQPTLHFARQDRADRPTDFSGDGGFHNIIFAPDLEDIDGYGPSSVGVTVDLELPVANERGLLDVLLTLNQLGWVSENGRWSIDQLRRTWHGIGIIALIKELPYWEARADHGSEQVSYYDRCDGGYYVLSADIDANSLRRVTNAQLSFQLEGLPLDPTPLVHLCRSLGIHQNVHARSRGEQLTPTQSFRTDKVGLTVHGLVTTTDTFKTHGYEEWVTGLIAHNPFSKTARATNTDLPMALSELRESEYLVCSLNDYHPLNGEPRGYTLSRLRWTWAGNRLLCAFLARWD